MAVDNHSPSLRTRCRNLGFALTVVIVTTATEFLFRRFVMFWLPTIGNLRANDLIALLAAYSLLLFLFGLATQTVWKEQLKEVGNSLRDLVKTWDYVPWLLLLAASSILLSVDHLLWGGAKLMPWFASEFHNPLRLFVKEAAVIKVTLLISVNGVFVPVAEEFLWRGIVQVHLLRLMSPSWAIGVTAVLFSFKHVVVDDSFGRLLFISAFGIICGIVAYRKSWRASAAVHIFANTVGTIVSLIGGSI